MGREIERKFLVVGKGWRDGAEGVVCRQGYLAFGPPASVRVRVMGGEARLTIKESTLGISRAEFEVPLAVEDAEALLERFCRGRLVEKTRYRVCYDGRVWEIDEFGGANAGLVVAEIELESEDAEFSRPSWLGEEVSGDPRYLNSNLAQRPYSTW